MQAVAIVLSIALAWLALPSSRPDHVSAETRSVQESQTPAHAHAHAASPPTPELAATGMALWGNVGHRIVAEVAVERLPTGIPAFFRAAGSQLAYLNPEPDRWREGQRREMDEAFQYDHYIDLENVPAAARSARDRWEFLEALHRAGIENPHEAAGFLPFHILELHQRLTSAFVRWRRVTNAEERRWIEARIVHDAGILGHYVADAANPHHTTIHYNGWDESRARNPGGYTTDSAFHARFETRFVAAHVRRAAVLAVVPRAPADLGDARAAVWRLIDASHALVPRLYELDRDRGFPASGTPHPESLAFATGRLAAGAELLRDLWWSAWVQSGR